MQNSKSPSCDDDIARTPRCDTGRQVRLGRGTDISLRRKTDIDNLLGSLDRERLDDAVAFAALPMAIKGYGRVKDGSIDNYLELLPALITKAQKASEHMPAA